MDNQKDNSFVRMEYVDKILFIHEKLDIPLKKLAEEIYKYLRKNNPNDDTEGENEKKYVESLLKTIQRAKENKTKTREKTVLRLKEAFTVLLCLPKVKKLNLPSDFEDWEDRENVIYIRELCDEYFQLLDESIVSKPNERFLDNLNYIIQAANNGHVQAQTAIGEYYFNGGKLEIPNFVLAAEYFTRAANENCPRALWKLGLMQEDNDLGLSPHAVLAFRYFKLSAEQNFPMALNRLACCYGNGYGVKRDDKQFFEYAQKSAKLNDEIGKLSVAYAYSVGKGVEQNLEEAANIYKEMRKNSNYKFHCTARLAYLYDKGLGVEVDKELSKEFYKELKSLLPKQYQNDDGAFQWFLNVDLNVSPYKLLYQFKENLKIKLLGSKNIFKQSELPRYAVPNDEANIWHQ